MFLQILQNWQEEDCVGASFLIELQVCNVIKKETPAQAFSCDFYGIFENAFFIEHFRAPCSIVFTGNTKFFEFFFLLTLYFAII